MIVTFCLPGATNEVSGGYKVIYTYANMLSQKGHDVNIVYGSKNLSGVKWVHQNKFLWNLAVRLFFGSKPKWFELEKNINVMYSYEGLTDESIPNSDVVFATAVDTALEVSVLSASKGRKYYLVQGLEKWEYGEDYVYKTYAAGLHIIAVSGWLKELAIKHGAKKCSCVLNGIEQDYFSLKKPIKERNKYAISMLFHRLEDKGSAYGIEALELLKKDYPELEVTLFGTVKRPTDLPEWMTYVHKATKAELNDIYNKSAIYLCPTIFEGFGLTSLESMACGCALVTTNYEGCLDFVKSGENALTCDVRNGKLLYQNMKQLIENDELRFYIANNGVETASEMSWENAVDKLLEIIA